MPLRITSIHASRRRRVLLGAGVATLAMSLALSIAPTLAKNSGTVKIHDVQAGTDIDASLNDPHVCTFTVVLDYSDPAETGSWQIVSKAPTGDGSQISAGSYDTTGGELYETDVLTLDPGHYQLDWQAAGFHSSRHKTFWVECAPAGGSGGGSSPGETGNPGAGDSGNTDNGGDQGGNDQGGNDQGNADNGGDQGGNDQGNADNGGDQGGNDQGNADNGGDQGGNDQGNADNGGSQNDDHGTTSDSGTGGSGSEQGSQSDTSGSTPEGGVKAVTSPAKGGGQASLPDTAFKVPTQSLSAILTAIGLLLLIAAHPFMRHTANADRG
jgi:hypothetical protein